MATDDEDGNIKLAPCSETSLEDPYKAHIIYSQEDVAFSNESDFDYSEQSTDDYLEALEAVRLPVLSVSQRFGHLITGQLSKLRQDEEFSFPAHKVLKDDETQTESVPQTTASTNSKNCVVDLVDLKQMQSTIRRFAEILITVVRLSKIVSAGSGITGEIESNKMLLGDVRAKFTLLEKEISSHFRCNVNNTTKWTEFNPLDDLQNKDQSAQIESVEGDDRSLPTDAQISGRPNPAASLCRLSRLFQQARGSEGLSRETGLRQGQEILATDMMNILSIVREMIDDVTRQINFMTENDRKTKDIGLNTGADQSSDSDVSTDDTNDAKTDGHCSDNGMDSRQADTLPSISPSNADSKISMDDLAMFFSALSHFASESGLSIETASESHERNHVKTRNGVCAGDTNGTTDSIKSEVGQIQGNVSCANGLSELGFDSDDSSEFGDGKELGIAGYGGEDQTGGDQELIQAGAEGQESGQAGVCGQAGAEGHETGQAEVGGQGSGHDRTGNRELDQAGVCGQESGQAGGGGHELGQAESGGIESGHGRKGGQESDQATDDGKESGTGRTDGQESIHEGVGGQERAEVQEFGQPKGGGIEPGRGGSGGEESGQTGVGAQELGPAESGGQESSHNKIDGHELDQADVGGQTRAGGQESSQEGVGGQELNKAGSSDQESSQAGRGGQESAQGEAGGQESIHEGVGGQERAEVQEFGQPKGGGIEPGRGGSGGEESGQTGVGAQELGPAESGGQESGHGGTDGQESDQASIDSQTVAGGLGLNQAGVGGQELRQARGGGQESGQTDRGSQESGQTGVGGQESGQTGRGSQESGQIGVGGQESGQKGVGGEESGQAGVSCQSGADGRESGLTGNGAEESSHDKAGSVGEESGQSGVSGQEADQASDGGQESNHGGAFGKELGQGGVRGEETGQSGICRQTGTDGQESGQAGACSHHDSGQTGAGGQESSKTGAGDRDSGQSGVGKNESGSGQDSVVGQQSGQADDGDKKPTQIGSSCSQELGQYGKGGQETSQKGIDDQDLAKGNDTCSIPSAGDGSDDSGQAGVDGQSASQTGTGGQNSGQDDAGFQGSNQTSNGGQKSGQKGIGGCDDISGQEPGQRSNVGPVTSQGRADGQTKDKTNVSSKDSGHTGIDNQGSNQYGVCGQDSVESVSRSIRKTEDDLRGEILRARPSHSDTCLSTGKRGRLKSLISGGADKTTQGNKRKSQTHAQPKKTGNERCLGRRLMQATCAVVSLAGLMGALVKGPSGSPLLPALLDDMSRIMDMEYI